MSDWLGLNVDPANELGRPDPAELAALRVGWVRVVARPGVEGYARRCREVGIRVLLVIARESLDTPVARYTSFPMDTVQLGNEPDGTGVSSWSMSRETYRGLWDTLSPSYLRLDIPVISAGLCSQDPEWLRGLELPGCSAIAIHPYGCTPEGARQLIRRYRAITGLPVWATEWNISRSDMVPFYAMLRAETAAAMWFCASNGMVPGHGLEQDGKLEVWKMLPELAELQARIDLLEKQGSLRDNVLREIVKGDYPAAEGMLKALMGGSDNPENETWAAAQPLLATT